MIGYNLEDRVALVTGGSRGIGRAIALAFAKQGSKVAICYRSNSEDAGKTLSLIGQYQQDALVLQSDVGRRRDVREMIRTVTDRWGKIDILVNNACPPFTGVRIRAEQIRPMTWKDMIDTALTGAFICSQMVIPLMKKQGWGRIVNISSGWGIRGTALLAHYSAAKAGLIGLTTSLADELGKSGILVNAVTPGLTQTEAVVQMPESYSDAYLRRNPLARLAEVGDVASAVLYLSSEQNQYINGHVLSVSGGLF